MCGGVGGQEVQPLKPSRPALLPPTTPPPRPSGAAHLDLLFLSCQNLVRKGGLDSCDWK